MASEHIDRMRAERSELLDRVDKEEANWDETGHKDYLLDIQVSAMVMYLSVLNYRIQLAVEAEGGTDNE
jgi:hypothetical protein